MGDEKSVEQVPEGDDHFTADEKAKLQALLDEQEAVRVEGLELPINTPPQSGEVPNGPGPQPGEPGAVFMTECAFLVYLKDGHWIADGEKVGIPTHMARPATTGDFFHAVTTIERDLMISDVAQATAQHTVMAQQQMAQQMMAAQRSAAVAAQVAAGLPGAPTGGVDLSGFKRGG